MISLLVKISQELLLIDADIPERLSKPFYNINNFELYDFDQIWPSTALGFSGMGGQAMTTARTYVLIPTYMDENCYVYFAGRFAYAVPWSSAFSKDVREGKMRPVRESGYYVKAAREQFAIDNEDYMK